MQIILAFSVIVPAVLVITILLFNSRMSDALKRQTADMIQNLNTQVAYNIDNSLKTIDDNINMILADTDISDYVPGETVDSAMEEDIDTALYTYAINSSYIDYGIVYSNGSTLGKISHELLSAGGSDLYSTLEKALKRSTGGWTSEVIPGRTELMSLRRINDYAIGVASIPAASLTENFKDNMFVEGMEIYVADRSLVVISTTDESVAAGSYLKTQISRVVNRDEVNAQIGENYVVATNKLNNGWYVITAVPTYDILRVLSDTSIRLIIAAIILSIIVIAYVVFMAFRISASINQTVDKLDVKAQKDLLTNLYNKRSFEEIVDTTLNNPEPGMSYALIFMDVDNFKGVNDRCGHDVGDMVLKKFAQTIGQAFRDSDIMGRLGGDEFCVLVKMPDEEDKNKLISNINEVCKRFTDLLHRHANSARQDMPAVTSSMGAALWDGVPEGFEQLYHKADTALYASKKRGKDTWTIYGQNMAQEPKK